MTTFTMTAQNIKLAGLLAAALTLVAGAAPAQISPKGGPIDITADALDANNTEHVTIWKGHVEALQGDDRLRADQLNVYFKSSRPEGAAKAPAGAAGADFGQLDHMEASGNVYLVTPTQVVRGDRAVYTAASQTTVITGKVVVTQGQNVLTGQRLVVNQQTGQSSMVGGAGERPRAVVYTEKKSQGPSH